MKCLIIAAGQGTRLRTRGAVKPLVPLLGVPLIERVIRSAMEESGVDDFYVVTGYQGEAVALFLRGLSKRLKIAVTLIHNDDWQKENGLSVLKARDLITEPFLLLMADHIFESSVLHSLQNQTPNEGDVLLVVDSNMENSLVDMEDVTKVQFKNNHILHIGKTIDDFNGFDTGLFFCTPAIFEALERSHTLHNDTTLSGAIRLLADEKHAKPVQAHGFWIDVDDEKAFLKAERRLLKSLHGKSNDGPVARWLNRPISTRISKVLVRFNIVPNQISFFSFMLSAIAAGLFALGSYGYLAFGGILAQFASIIDGSDGEVARLKYLSSDYGGWFDAVLDRYADALLLFGLTWYVYSQTHAPLVFIIGFFAIIGSFMLSYTADKYDHLMKNRVNKGIRVGRDIRVFFIFLGAVLNQPYPVLIVVAIWMNAETIHRIILCREDGDPITCAKEKIRTIISKSSVPEDPLHAENILDWILKLAPDADEALQIAALAHDIDRADEKKKIQRTHFKDYDAFKAAHAKNGAKILKGILQECHVEQAIINEACRLVERHEVGGDPSADLLKDADSISYFDVNMPLYFQREGYEETLRRCIWGYNRLSPKMKEICANMTYSQQTLNKILKETLFKGSESDRSFSGDQ